MSSPISSRLLPIALLDFFGGWQQRGHRTGLCRGAGQGRAGARCGAPWDGRVSAYQRGEVGLCGGDSPAGRPAAHGGATEQHAAPAHTELPGGLQGDTQTAVPWRIGEMRRLVWCLVLATQQRVARLLAWSSWRRWHHGRATSWPNTRRAGSYVQLEDSSDVLRARLHRESPISRVALGSQERQRHRHAPGHPC
jgi:hypothetical protein